MSQPDDIIPHVYMSTACMHDKHDCCRDRCKFCGAACDCECHTRHTGMVFPIAQRERAR